MKKLIRIAIIAIACMTLLSLFCFAQNKTVKVGFFSRNGYHNVEYGVKSGYGYDLLQFLARYSDMEFEYVGYENSWDEMILMLESGEIDMFTAAQKTPELERRFDFSSRNIGTTSTVLSVKAGNKDIIVGEYSTYNGMLVGMLSSYEHDDSFEKFAESCGFTYDVRHYRNMHELENALQNGYIDAIVSDDMRIKHDEWILDIFNSRPFYAVVRKGDHELLSEINDAIAQIDRNETNWRLRLYDKYFTVKPSDMIHLRKDESEYLKTLSEEKRTFTVLVNPDRYPYSYLKDGEITGILPSIWHELAGRIDIEFEFMIPENRPEYLEMLMSGKPDICLDMSDDFSIAEEYGYLITDSYLSADFTWIKRRHFDGEMKRVAMIRNSEASRDESASELPLDVERVYYSSHDECIDSVRRGETDGCLVYAYRAERIMFDDVNGELISTRSFTGNNFSIGVSKREDWRLVSILNKAVASLDEEVAEKVIVSEMDFGKPVYTVAQFFKSHIDFFFLFAILVVAVVFLLILSFLMRKAQYKLEIAVETANEANRAKSAFLSRMTHDIRTPIAGIMGMAEVAERYADNKEKVIDSVTKITKSAKNLLFLVNDVLDMSRIEAGKSIKEEHSFDICELVDECAAITYGKIADKKLDFIVDSKNIEHKAVFGRRLAISRILTNLLGNAVKYTPDFGKIKFIVREKSCHDGMCAFEFVVEDTGIGMSHEFQKHMFEAFAQEKVSARGTYEGVGLGMAIAKKLVDELSGELLVKSTPGKGTRFTVNITLKYCEIEEVENTPAVETDFSGKKVLVADDVEINRDFIRCILEDEGFEVLEAVDGETCIDAFRKSAPGEISIIIMDIMMPGIDGLEATRAIRKLDRPDSDVPIFAMSANISDEDVRKSLDAGANEHLPKTIETVALREIMAMYIKGE